MASTCSCAGAREVSQLSNRQYGAVLALNFLKNEFLICLAAILTEHFILTELNVCCSFGLKLTLLRPAVDRLDRQQELEEGMKRQQLLFNELQHRVNNTLTTIRAVAADAA